MGGGSPIKNSNTSDFGEIWTINVNLPKKNNRSDKKPVGGLVKELCGAAVPELLPPPFKLQIHQILMKFRPYK